MSAQRLQKIVWKFSQGDEVAESSGSYVTVFVKIASVLPYTFEQISDWPPDKINKIYLEIARQEFYQDKFQAVLHGADSQAIGDFNPDTEKREQKIATIEDLHSLGEFAPSIKKGE